MDDGKPPPRAGNWFVAVHGGRSRPGEANDNNIYELFDFNVTLTGRVTVPLDRVGDQLIARNINLVPLAQRQGFNAKLEQIRAYLHMNWQITVLTGQTPLSANDNLSAWSTGTVYGFCEPARYEGADIPTLAEAGWMGEELDDDVFAIKSEMRFRGAKRFQPQLLPIGPFV